MQYNRVECPYGSLQLASSPPPIPPFPPHLHLTIDCNCNCPSCVRLSLSTTTTTTNADIIIIIIHSLLLLWLCIGLILREDPAAVGEYIAGYICKRYAFPRCSGSSLIPDIPDSWFPNPDEMDSNASNSLNALNSFERWTPLNGERWTRTRTLQMNEWMDGWMNMRI